MNAMRVTMVIVAACYCLFQENASTSTEPDPKATTAEESSARCIFPWLVSNVVFTNDDRIELQIIETLETKRPYLVEVPPYAEPGNLNEGTTLKTSLEIRTYNSRQLASKFYAADLSKCKFEKIGVGDVKSNDFKQHVEEGRATFLVFEGQKVAPEFMRLMNGKFILITIRLPEKIEVTPKIWGPFGLPSHQY